MNMLITGTTGFLGWNLARWFTGRGHRVTGSAHRNPPVDDHNVHAWIPLDLNDAAGFVLPEMCDLVVHCAAMSSAMNCSRHPEAARRINVEGTSALAELAAKRSIPFVFISTDLVFDGCRAPYHEEDSVRAATWYGETKCLAEERVRTISMRHFILRTALMYGVHHDRPGSFLGWTVDALQSGAGIRLYTNQFRNPLFAPDVARCIEALLPAEAYGTYHLGGPERYSRCEIGYAVARSMKLDPGAITPVLLERGRPPGPVDDTTLRTEKIRLATGVHFTPLLEGLEHVRFETGTGTKNIDILSQM